MELRRLRSALTAVPGRLLRAVLLWLSRRRGLGQFATATPLTRPLVERFVAGETLAEALPALRRMHVAGFHTTVDVLGESVLTAADAVAAAERYVRTLDGLAGAHLDRNVSLKLSQMGLRIDEDLCRENVLGVVAHAERLGAFVRIDMEDSSTTERTLAIHRTLVRKHRDVGVVIQAALRRSEADIDDLIGRGVRVRLCKGAYAEPPSVAFASKTDVDASYARLMTRLLREGAYPAFATHDDRLIRQTIAIARRERIAADRFEFQMLFGVQRDLQERLRRAGYAVRVYVPYGREWYPYFMRRLAERPANVAFVLRSLFGERGQRGR